jgi:hypothetical protein
VLNRHAIVLFLGTAAILALVRVPPVSYPLTGISFLVMLVGLLLDVDRPGARAAAARLLQAAGVLLAFGASISSRSSTPLALAEAGIALAVLGVLLEMVIGYRALRLAAAAQASGDAIYVLAFALALVEQARVPSSRGWVFIALAGAISLFAALYNLQLQLRRLRDLQAGWRYRVLPAAGPMLRLSTPSGEARVAWSDVKAVERLDARHLILFLPAPLPPQLVESGLPLDELKGAHEVAGDAGPETQYCVILHEQEIGRPLPQAEEEFRRLAGAARALRE